jgi:1,3-beta-glucan synthase
LRKRRVFRYAVMYFVMLVIFLALIVGPIVAGSGIIPSSLSKQQIAGMYLFQPHNLSNNDTQGTLATGTGNVSNTGGGSSASKTAGARVRLF